MDIDKLKNRVSDLNKLKEEQDRLKEEQKIRYAGQISDYESKIGLSVPILADKIKQFNSYINNISDDTLQELIEHYFEINIDNQYDEEIVLNFVLKNNSNCNINLSTILDPEAYKTTYSIVKNNTTIYGDFDSFKNQCIQEKNEPITFKISSKVDFDIELSYDSKSLCKLESNTSFKDSTCFWTKGVIGFDEKESKSKVNLIIDSLKSMLEYDILTSKKYDLEKLNILKNSISNLDNKFNYNIKFIIEVKLQSSVDSLFKRLEEFGLQIINHRFNCPNVNNFYVSIKCKNPLRPTVIE